MLALLLALVAAAAEPKDPVAEAFDQAMSDHLEPIQVRIPAYDAALERTLGVGAAKTRLEIVEKPSFEPEGRASVVERDGQYEVVSVSAGENVWYGSVMRDVPPRPPRDPEHRAKDRRCAAPIANATYEKLRRVWRAAMDGASPSDRFGLDGTTWVFGLEEPGQPPRKASTWSPDPGTRVLALVRLGQSLMELACGGAAKEADVAAAADALAVRFGAR